MYRLGAVVFLFAVVCLGADFKQAKIVDFQDASMIGGGTVSGTSSNGVPTTPTTRVGSTILKCEITLSLDGQIYTTEFPQDSHFQVADLTRGAFIPVKIEGKKIALQRPSDGKEVKGKILKIEKETGTEK